MANPKGNQASGDTGLNTWMMGFIARLNFLLSPQRKPKGTAMSVAMPMPIPTHATFSSTRPRRKASATHSLTMPRG